MFFLKVWAKNVGAHYTWQNTVTTTNTKAEHFPWDANPR